MERYCSSLLQPFKALHLMGYRMAHKHPMLGGTHLQMPLPQALPSRVDGSANLLLDARAANSVPEADCTGAVWQILRLTDDGGKRPCWPHLLGLLL